MHVETIHHLEVGDPGPGQPAAVGPEPPRIGPNSLRQTLTALRETLGPGWGPYVAARAALPDPVPRHMVEERYFVELVRVLVDELGPEMALTVLERSGELTGRYVLSCRIPSFARGALRFLPPRLALRPLLDACRRHAWTFVGSGTFRHLPDGPGALLEIHGSPTCRHGRADRPMGSFYTGAFQYLIRSLVSPDACVAETQCMATGAPSCRFRVTLPAHARWRPARFVPSTPRPEVRPCAS